MKLFNWLVTQFLIISSALSQYVKAKQEPASPSLVARRFRQLFMDHGVEETQIPRIFSKVTLEDLKSDDALLKKLTPATINEAAELFKVRTEWIEGVDEKVYSHWSCYKRPKLFFELLNTIKYDDFSFPLRIITTTPNFNYKNGSHQPFSILFVEHITDLGDESVCRYVLDTGWSWEESPCRVQLKAMAMLYWKQTQQPITIYKVPYDVYQRITDLTLIPDKYLLGPLITNPSLEDYVIEPAESGVSKEVEEIPRVLKFIEEYSLSEIKVCESLTDIENSDSLISKSPAELSKVISEMNRKNAKSRYESLDKHKEQFKRFYLQNGYQHKSSAARDYFTRLSLEDKKIVVPSYYEQDHENCVEKAVRTLREYLKE